MPLIDPLADLKAEIAAEEAVEAAKTAAPAADEPPVEEDAEPEPVEAKPEPKKPVEAAEKPAEKPAAEKPKPKAPAERMVPAERLNEYAVKNRQLERRLETMAEDLEKLKNPNKPQPQARQPTLEEIRAEERTRAKLDLTIETFTAEGTAEFGETEFNEACQRIQDLIGKPNNLVSIAVAALDNPKQAALALGRLGKKDAPEIEAFLKMPEAKMGRMLEKYLNERAPRAEKAEKGSPRKARVEEPEEPPEPLRTINGAARVEEGLGDDVPDDVWFKRFDETILNKPKH